MDTDKIIYQYPPIWRRFAALVYDSLLLLAVSMAYGAIALTLQNLLSNSEEKIVSGLVFQLGWLGSIVGFYCYFWIKAGQTLGMRAWRLEVITKDKQRLMLKHALIRSLSAPIGLLLFITVFFREDRQCLHDLISQSQTLLRPKESKKS